MKHKMFNSLRNRFLVLVMSIFSIVMIVAFAVIYFVTYRSLQAEYGRIYESGSVVHGEEVIVRYSIADIVGRDWIMTSLLSTLLIVGLILLFVILAVSFYFANRAIRPIADTWEKQKQFITDASHELKTPLTIIKSNYGLLLSNREETIESQMEWLENIDIGADRMAKLVDDLLTLAKIGDSDMQVRFEMFDLSSLIEKAAQSMEAAAAEKGIQVFREIERGIEVCSDSDRIAQVAAILLDNAIKYTDRGGRIGVSLRKSKRHVTCTVKNSGAGIPEEDIPKIFDRFYRTDSSRNSESGGCGLGLPIAKAIMEKLGGEISAAGAENEGASFAFTL